MSSTYLRISRLRQAILVSLGVFLMQSSSIKWIIGSVAFFLPTITEVVANQFLRQSLPTTFLVSIVLAAIIPPALVLSSSVKGRIAIASGLWVLLFIQYCLILLSLLAGFRE